MKDIKKYRNIDRDIDVTTCIRSIDTYILKREWGKE